MGSGAYFCFSCNDEDYINKDSIIFFADKNRNEFSKFVKNKREEM